MGKHEKPDVPIDPHSVIDDELQAAREYAAEEGIDESTDPASLLERLRNIDHKDYVAAAAVVGVVAISVAAFIAKRRGFRTADNHSLVISRTDRRLPTVSLVEITDKLGDARDIAASFPVGRKAAKELLKEKAKHEKTLFVMGGEEGAGVKYPLKGDAKHEDAYRKATKKAARWLVGVLSSADKDSGTE